MLALSSLLLASALVQGGSDSTSTLPRPGISLALARTRAATISDVRYELALDITARDSAVGRVEIRFHRYTTVGCRLGFHTSRSSAAIGGWILS